MQDGSPGPTKCPGPTEVIVWLWVCPSQPQLLHLGRGRLKPADLGSCHGPELPGPLPPFAGHRDPGPAFPRGHSLALSGPLLRLPLPRLQAQNRGHCPRRNSDAPSCSEPSPPSWTGSHCPGPCVMTLLGLPLHHTRCAWDLLLPRTGSGLQHLSDLQPHFPLRLTEAGKEGKVTCPGPRGQRWSGSGPPGSWSVLLGVWF